MFYDKSYAPACSLVGGQGSENWPDIRSKVEHTRALFRLKSPLLVGSYTVDKLSSDWMIHDRVLSRNLSGNNIHPLMTLSQNHTVQCPSSLTNELLLTLTKISLSWSWSASQKPTLTDDPTHLMDEARSFIQPRGCISKHILLNSLRNRRRSQPTYCGICCGPCTWCKIWKVVSHFNKGGFELARTPSRISTSSLNR